MQLCYALAGLCLFDWFYQLFQSIIRVDFIGIFDYFSYLFHLWKSRPLIITLLLFICFCGIPKFFSFIRRSLDVLKKLLQSIIKTPIIINIPLWIYLLIVILKFSLFASKFIHRDYCTAPVTEEKTRYWNEIQQSLAVYRYSTLTTLVLFFLGMYSLATNRLIYQMTKKMFSTFAKQIKIIQRFLTTPIRTPLSLIIVLSFNLLIHLFPRVSLVVYELFSQRWMIYLGIVLLIVYCLYNWLWPGSKLSVDLSGEIVLNDVSRLNETRVYSLFYPRTVNDIEYLINRARNEGRTISIRGQAHTMGGQTLPSRKDKRQNYVCDLKYLNVVEYDEERKEVLVECGATWTHVIKKLNCYGRSPVVMQSYCTFSVGGTISVNAHGITSDDAMCESVLNIEYIDMNGKRAECNREKNKELFSLMIGGYGLFGVMTRLRLRTVSNVKTSLEYLRLQSDQFTDYYEGFLNDPTIEIKIARVDLVRPNNILMFVFRQENGTSGTVADLSDEARVMHPRQHLIYTYLAQHRLFRRIRFALEKIAAQPLDLTYSTDRNTTMYESAKPMALLYQPLTYYDDTFILQEYFIPKKNFNHWYNQLGFVVRQKYENVFLLNLTIRFVKKDELTYLSYTRNGGDSYAFVFYFRMKRNELGDDEVRMIHQELIRITFECDGTFYLPYRQHYSYEQILHSYPNFDEFIQKKNHYDSIGLFSNDWFEHFTTNQRIPMTIHPSDPVEISQEKFQIVQQRRMDSFSKVIFDEILREKFRKFLRTVFDAEPVHVIFNYVNRAVRNPLNQNDHDVYRELQHILNTRQFAFLRKLFALFKQIRQLRLQIKDMLRQLITIFKHLGYLGKIKDIATFGDGGRCINELRQILKIKDGRVYIVNESQKLTDIIERNTLFPLGTFLPYNFSNLTDVPIPGESVDLVTCLMGLHHLPQEQLPIFLKMVYRILRPNGLFVFREHHAHEGLKPLLDVAHMVFNAVTRVDYETEIKEIRAFRTIEQWRSCLREAGFVDTFIYDEQEDDPTDDIMIVMRKPAEVINPETVDEDIDIEKEDYQRIIAAPESNYFRPCEWLVVRIANQFASSLNHTPFFLFPYMKYLSIYWSLFRTETELAISKFGLKTAVISSVGFLMDSVIGILITGAFVQLSFFSFLIRVIGGVRAKPEYEQIVIDGLEENYDFENLIDPQIDDVQPLRKSGRYAIRVRRHRAFTASLKKLALHSNYLTLISISNLQDQIQVELTINNNDNERLLWLKQRSNQSIIYEYKNPIDQTQTTLFIAVPMKHLFSFIRDCQPFEQDHSLTIVQIHDYYD